MSERERRAAFVGEYGAYPVIVKKERNDAVKMRWRGSSVLSAAAFEAGFSHAASVAWAM